MSFQGIKIEPSTLKQSEMSDSEDPLHIETIVKDEFLEEIENQNPSQTYNYHMDNMQSNQIQDKNLKVFTSF